LATDKFHDYFAILGICEGRRWNGILHLKKLSGLIAGEGLGCQKGVVYEDVEGSACVVAGVGDDEVDGGFATGVQGVLDGATVAPTATVEDSGFKAITGHGVVDLRLLLADSDSIDGRGISRKFRSLFFDKSSLPRG
jgi:hypothetical protein